MFELRPDEPMVMVQSAGTVDFSQMLQGTCQANSGFCARHDIRYACLLAVLRGYYPWHACYNHILILNRLIDLDYEGWFLHLDARAYVQDPACDLRAYLAARGHHSLIASSDGSNAFWAVDDSICFVNCAHPVMRDIARRWRADLDALTPGRLRAARDRTDLPSGQALLQGLLRANPGLAQTTLLESRDFVGSPLAGFARSSGGEGEA